MALTAMTELIGQTSPLMYILPVAGTMLVFFGIYQVFTESKAHDQKKVRDRLRGERASSETAADSLLRRNTKDMSKSLAEAMIGKLKVVPKLQSLINQADLDWSASSFLFNIGAAAVIAAFGLIAMQVNIVAAMGSGGACIILPLVWLSFTRNRRMTKLANQLPDVFEMMSQALRAGHSLAGAVQLIYEQVPPPIATEFAQVYHEQNLGIKIEDALKSMADRVDSLDVRFFVTAVLIQRQTGGDLAEVLDNISGVIRERIELAGLVRGLTAEGRLSGWVLFALPFLVFGGSMYLNPDYANTLLEDPRGKIMLMVAAGMQLMGIAMIRWIVNIKV